MRTNLSVKRDLRLGVGGVLLGLGVVGFLGLGRAQTAPERPPGLGIAGGASVRATLVPCCRPEAGWWSLRGARTTPFTTAGIRFVAASGRGGRPSGRRQAGPPAGRMRPSMTPAAWWSSPAARITPSGTPGRTGRTASGRAGRRWGASVRATLVLCCRPGGRLVVLRGARTRPFTTVGIRFVTASGPRGWASIGVPTPTGGATSGPDAALNDRGGLALFARGNDNAIWHAWQDQPDSKWSRWVWLETLQFPRGYWTSDPSAVLQTGGRLVVFAGARTTPFTTAGKRPATASGRGGRPSGRRQAGPPAGRMRPSMTVAAWRSSPAARITPSGTPGRTGRTASGRGNPCPNLQHRHHQHQARPFGTI